MKCDVCGIRERSEMGSCGFISWDGGGINITRTCDECWKLSVDEAMALQQKTLSCITFADGVES